MTATSSASSSQRTWVRTPAGISLPGGACLPPACLPAGLSACRQPSASQHVWLAAESHAHHAVPCGPAPAGCSQGGGQGHGSQHDAAGTPGAALVGCAARHGTGGPCVLALPVLYKTAGRLVTAAAAASCCLRHQMARANASAGALVPANCRLLPAEKLAFAANWVARNVLR